MTLLRRKAAQCRTEVIAHAVKHGKGHIAPSLSTVDILVALYYDVMRRDDVFILSKGHGCYALYWILQDKGSIPKHVWDEWDPEVLPGCLERCEPYGIPCSTGSMGHGLPQAVGLAWGMKLQEQTGQVYCMVGDGEMQEGSNWEALIYAKERDLTNLTVLIDDNQMQAMDFTCMVGGTQMHLRNRLVGFGLSLHEVHGHHLGDIVGVLETTRSSRAAIQFKTKKGFGMPCSYGKTEFHYRVPTPAELGEEKE